MKKQISSLQYITTSAHLAEQACAGGVDWIQLRLKNVSYEDYKKEARAVQQICKKYDATFIINDNVDLALEIKSDGVHVGKGDPLTSDHIAALLNGSFIIGCTANSIDDFLHLSGKAVDYIGLGPFRFTTTKQNLSPILGLEGYERIFREIAEHQLTPPPVVGIGGITESDVPALLATPLHGIAVSGAISNAKDVTTTARIFKNLTNKMHNEETN
jgi:thiamine-phosphate pyrophosphorylase